MEAYVHLRKNIYSALKIIMYSKKPVTRKELALKMDVSEVTAGKVVKYLIDSGYFVENKRLSPNHRACGEITFMKSNVFALLSLEESHFNHSVFSGTGEIIYRKTIPYNETLGLNDNVQQLARIMDNYFYDRPYFEPLAIGVLKKNDTDNIELLYKPKIYLERTYESLIETKLINDNKSSSCIYFRFSERIYAYMCFNGHIFNGLLNEGKIPNKDITNEFDMYRYLLNFFSEFFCVIIPNRIIIESEKFYITIGLIQRLKHDLTKLLGRLLPEIIVNKECFLPECAMYDEFCDIFANIIV